MATASCVVNAGAMPVFADVDPDSGNLTAATIERVHHAAHARGHLRPPGRLAVRHGPDHGAGASEHGLKVIEDCAQAHGARYKGRSVGSHRPRRRMVLLPGQDHDHRRRRRHGHDQRRSAVARACGPTRTTARATRPCTSASTRRAFAGCTRASAPTGGCWRCRPPSAASSCAAWRIGRRAARATHQAVWNACQARTACGAAFRSCAAHGCRARPLQVLRLRRARRRSRAGWTPRSHRREPSTARACPATRDPAPRSTSKEPSTTPAGVPAERLPVARELGETSLMFLVHPTLTTIADRQNLHRRQSGPAGSERMMLPRLDARSWRLAFYAGACVLVFAPSLCSNAGDWHGVGRRPSWRSSAGPARPARIPAQMRCQSGLLGFGAGIELLQSTLPYRAAEWTDLLADGVGLMLASRAVDPGTTPQP